MFEKYQKAARDIPNKKEREEIETMKNQVCFQHCQKIYQFTKKKQKKPPQNGAVKTFFDLRCLLCFINKSFQL
jgi:hypothetical protein